MPLFVETETWTVPRHGEEVCGDTIRVVRTPGRVLAILSDGLGNGIRASVASTLIVEILSRMLSARLPLRECLAAIGATLPLQGPTGGAYATFLVVDVDRETGACTVLNYGNPPVLRFEKTGRVRDAEETVSIDGRDITIHRCTFGAEGILVAMSDGVVGAGPGTHLDPAWDLAGIERRLAGTLLLQKADASAIVRDLAAGTLRQYAGRPGDDCSLLVLRARRGRHLTLFTGPPSDPATDDEHAAFFMNQPGRKIVCGGTTASIVSLHLGCPVRPVLRSGHDDLPPMSRIDGVDVTAEGLLTLLRVTEYLVRSQSGPGGLPESISGAAMITQELLAADSVLFLVGRAENTAYTTLHLPSSSLFRTSAIRQISDILQRSGKEVRTVFC